MFIMYLSYTWFIGICYGFVIISSAAESSDANLFHSTEALLYHLDTTTLLNEKNVNESKITGFSIRCEISVETIWKSDNENVLKFEIRNSHLHLYSPKTGTESIKTLEDVLGKPFYVIWTKGDIQKVFLGKKETASVGNFKKGIASLFQFQLEDANSIESDVSGKCDIDYRRVDATNIHKIKKKCISKDLPFRKTIDTFLGDIITSSYQISYELDTSLSYIKNIVAEETHHLTSPFQENLESYVTSTQKLKHIKNTKSESIKSSTLESVLQTINQDFIEDTLLSKAEEVVESQSLLEVIDKLKESLATKNLGNLISAEAFLKVLNVARKATKDEIVKVLSTKSYNKILGQIYDILGHVQTENSHGAAMKKLHFDKDKHLGLSERYLWASSMSLHPNPFIIKDLLKRYYKNVNYSEKIKETLILSLASMAQTLSIVNPKQQKIIKDVEELIVNGFNSSTETERYVFLRAAKNFRSPNLIPLLLKTIKTGSLKEEVLVFKALKSMDLSGSRQVLEVARQTFLQLDKKHDSSARTLAIDILLKYETPEKLFDDLFYFIKSSDINFEIKQYVFQGLLMISDENHEFEQKLADFIKSTPTLNNYLVLSPRGLSTALKRSFVKSSSVNGSLLTIHEVSSGIVKRGIVDVIIKNNRTTKEMFSLGIFAGGLGGFVGGGDEEGTVKDVATAGMELTILGTQIRPFVFFTGQGELMGHVWSGTGSERTTAFQSLILLQDNLQYIRLGSGSLARFSLKDVISFDLSGKIEISIWSRTAESIVEKSTGLLTIGSIGIDSAFVSNEIEFKATIEPKLVINTDIDFSDKVAVCTRVTQPESIFRHDVSKRIAVPHSKHNFKVSYYKKVLIPGTTYALHKKNNEMCSKMFT